MPYQVIRRALWALCCAGLAACATAPPAPAPAPIYPPPPAEPRFIYDATLRSDKDLSTPTAQENLINLISGNREQPLGFAKPYGIAVKNQRVYVSDTQQRAVLMFDLKQKMFRVIGAEGDQALRKPLGLAISADDELYVVDGSARRVAVYDREGHWLRYLGNKQWLQRPSGIALDPQGKRCFVLDVGGVDSDAHHIVVLDSHSGELLGHIGKRGSGEGEFNLPLQIASDAQGRLYVVDSGNFRVQVFDADGKFLRAFGSVGRYGGQFSRPKGIAADGAGRAYVVDTAFGNLQIFDEQGRLLLHIGDRGTAGSPGQFMLPAGIAVDEDGRIYVVDQFFRKVDIFRPVALPPLQLRP